jgi:hypothetical protein
MCMIADKDSHLVLYTVHKDFKRDLHLTGTAMIFLF